MYILYLKVLQAMFIGSYKRRLEVFMAVAKQAAARVKKIRLYTFSY